jgi:hypothetical protein
MRLRFDPSTTGDGKPKTANPIAIEDRNRRGKGVQGAGQFDFEHKSASLAAPPPPPPATEEQWEDAGFDWASQQRFKEVGATLDEALMWQDKGFEILDAVDWHKGGFSPEEASLWRASGFDVRKDWTSGAEDAKKLRDAGLDVGEASKWMEVTGNTGEEFDSYTSSLEQIKARRTDAADAVLEWREAGFSLEDTETLYSSHFTADDAIILRRNNISMEEARKWGVMNIRGTKVMAWRNRGFSPEEAGKWSSIGATSPAEVISLQNEGLTLEDVDEYREAHIYDAYEMIRMKQDGVSAEEWRLSGDGDRY